MHKKTILKLRRSKSFNKKRRYASEGFICMCQNLNLSIMDEPINSGARYKDIGKNKNSIIDVRTIDAKLKRKCLAISRDMQQMGAAERMVFVYDDPNFPKEEKSMMLDMCISVLEEIEDYELCSFLHKMRTRLNK